MTHKKKRKTSIVVLCLYERLNFHDIHWSRVISKIVERVDYNRTLRREEGEGGSRRGLKVGCWFRVKPRTVEIPGLRLIKSCQLSND